MERRSAADMEGPWQDPDFESNLIQRCRENWAVPICDVSNQVLATFVRQRVALAIAIPEAERRIAVQYMDETEWYDEELSVAVAAARSE